MKYIKTFLISVFMLLILVSPTALANTSIPVMVDNESSTVMVNTSTSSMSYKIESIPVLTYNETFGFIQSYINYLSEPLPGYTKSVTLTAVSNRPDETVTYLETISESFIKNGSILFKPNIQFGNCSQYYSNRSWYHEYYDHPFNPDATDKMSVTLYQNYLVIYDVNLNREYDRIDLNVKNGILYGTSRQDPSIVYLITLQKVKYSIVK